jgi:hypothetical protein
MGVRPALARFPWKAAIAGALTFAILFALSIPAQYEACKTAFGGGRWTRSAAEQRRRELGRPMFLLNWMPDSEFLPEPPPAGWSPP